MHKKSLWFVEEDKQDNECEADIDTDNSEEFVTHKKASSTERHREASSVCLPRDQIGEPPGECLPGNHTLDLLSGDDIISEPSDQDAFDKELLEIATRGYDIAMNNLSTTSADSSAIRVTKSIRRRGLCIETTLFVAKHWFKFLLTIPFSFPIIKVKDNKFL